MSNQDHPPAGEPQDRPQPSSWAAPPPPNPYGGPVSPAEAPTGATVRPPSLDRAVLLMRIGAALTLVSAVLVFTGRDEVRAAVEEGAAGAGGPLDPGLLDTLTTVGLVVAALFAVLGAALWLWMAWANGRGRSWARIVATILFGISTLFFLVGLLQPALGLQFVLDVLLLLVGAGAVWLMWRQESSAYYRAMSGPRY